MTSSSATAHILTNWKPADRPEAVDLAFSPPWSSATPHGSLEDYHLLHSARADLLRRLGRQDDAAGAYARALELASNPVERRFLERRLAAHADPAADQG
jgi:hypothetical protein